jgi:Transglycosylase-like domain
MRTRIALATAMVVSFMITSFNISTVAAQAATSPAATPSGTSSTGTSSTGAVPGHSPSAASLSINDLLWPQVIDTNLSATSTTTADVTTPAATSSSTPAPAPTPTPPPAAAPAPAPPPPPPTDTSSTDTADWQCIRVHESGDAYNDPTRPSGAYGILESTWESFGYSGWPYEAAPGVQDALALELYHEYGWNPWSTKTVCGLG